MTGPTLTTLDPHPILDLDVGIGQRSCTFRFELINGVTGEHLGDITPIRTATLTHDTTRTIKRQLSISLGQADTAAINPVSDRILVSMVLASGEKFPLGRYIFTDRNQLIYTSGNLAVLGLNDEMFLVDQEIEHGIDGVLKGCEALIFSTMKDLPVTLEVEPSPLPSTQSWGAGINRGSVLEALALAGDYFSPWFGNDGHMHFIRTFDPAASVADFDFDEGFRVIREPINQTDDLLTAPNRFIVVSNTATDPAHPVVGVADVPTNAPHSVINRGFVISKTVTLQLTNGNQAQQVATGLANRQTVFERVSLTTPPDPRHDSYNVIKWQGELWLELAWSMALIEGGSMNHLLRKSYQ